MKRTSQWILLAALAAAPVQASTPAPALVLQDAIASVAAQAKPAVVNISVVQERRVQVEQPDFFFGDPQDMLREFMQGQRQGPRPRQYRMRQEGTGSGFIFDSKGYVLTNEHVIRGATQIRVTMTGPDGKDKTYPGKVIGRDPNFDMAVVKIEANETFPSLRLSDKAPRVGDFAIAIGSPFALEQTVTLGIVSARRQTLQIEGRLYTKMIQTDAAINRGNSGGPLLNIDGDVIGINTAIFSPNGGSAGIGFAIPADEAQRALGYLMQGKKMSRGWIGIEMEPVNEIARRRFALPSADGALVNKVLPKSPAEKAGIERGDVVRSFDGQAISTPQDLLSATANLAADTKIKLGVYRNGKSMDVEMTLGERPDFSARQEEQEPGAQEQENEGSRESFKWEGVTFSQEQEGITVDSLTRESPLAGYLMPGDIVHGVNTKQVHKLGELKEAVESAKLSDGVFFDIVRDGQPMYLSVKP